jgi:hypothetical protein
LAGGLADGSASTRGSPCSAEVTFGFLGKLALQLPATLVGLPVKNVLELGVIAIGARAWPRFFQRNSQRPLPKPRGYCTWCGDRNERRREVMQIGDGNKTENRHCRSEQARLLHGLGTGRDVAIGGRNLLLKDVHELGPGSVRIEADQNSVSRLFKDVSACGVVGWIDGKATVIKPRRTRSYAKVFPASNLASFLPAPSCPSWSISTLRRKQHSLLEMPRRMRVRCRMRIVRDHHHCLVKVLVQSL